MEQLTPEEAQMNYNFLNRVAVTGVTEVKQMARLFIKLEAIATGKDIPRGSVTTIESDAEETG